MLEFFLNFGEIVIPALVILVGYTVGSINEKGHYKSIKKRETEFLPLPAVTMKTCLAPEEVNSAKMVVGSVVVSIDHFKRFLAVLRNFFGGRVSTYETLVDRARREAVLRMKKEAGEAKAIVNVRVETSAIGSSANRRGAVGSVEALAYGTAIY